MPRYVSWRNTVLCECKAWRCAVSEALGTALLVALGCASLLPAAAPLSHPALAFGFAVTLLASTFGEVSGAHLNPAVTLAAVLGGHTRWWRGGVYVAAQCAGSTAGVALLHAVWGAAPQVCTAVGPGVGAGGAALCEALVTGSLVLLLCALWRQHDARRPDHTASIKVGLAIAGLVYTGGPISGASLNPARSLGPALLYGCWKDHWVYWVGPLGGSALATLLYRVLAPPAPRNSSSSAIDPPASPEDLPLNDKAEP